MTAVPASIAPEPIGASGPGDVDVPSAASSLAGTGSFEVGETDADDWLRRSRPLDEVPVLAVDGFEGPLDWLLEMATANKIDLAKLSLTALVDSLIEAIDARLADLGRDALRRCADWIVMGASLTLLRSRLMLPRDAKEARAAETEAARMKDMLLARVAMRRGAAWLEARIQLGRDVFSRGSVAPADGAGVACDITELLRATLKILRVPEDVSVPWAPAAPVWRVIDAIARIRALLPTLPEGGALGDFLPGRGQEPQLGGFAIRTAIASTLVAGLELARGNECQLVQAANWESLTICPASKDDTASR